jgi:exodeoxyribonuclease-3
MDNFHKAGFIDSYRTLHPEEIKYTFWSMRFGARARNAGWRIDYFLLSKGIRENLKSADIHNEVMGSDHCPLSIELEF